MAKFYGVIGYIETKEKAPGVYEEVVTEHEYKGDLIRNMRRLQSSEQLNDNVNISNEFSIFADPFARENFHSMRYICYMGTKWKITSVEVLYPRLILTVGGVYNEQET